MDYRNLGNTGLKVSRVGIGGGGIAQMMGHTTETESVRTIHRAMDLGVNFFDVAPGYGNGKGEQVLGIALRDRRDSAIVGTKITVKPHEMEDIYRGVLRSVNDSLMRLRTDMIDVIHVHNSVGPVRKRNDQMAVLSGEDVLGPVMEALYKLRDEGKVRFFGIPSWHRDKLTIRRILESGHMHVILAYYNLLDWTSQTVPPQGTTIIDQAQTIPLAKSLNLGVIGIRSHAGGALTPQIDRPIEAGNHYPEDLDKAKTLKFLLEGRIHNLSQAAMVFCLMNEDIDTVVPGVKNVQEIEELISCVDLPPIPEHNLVKLRTLYARDFQE